MSWPSFGGKRKKREDETMELYEKKPTGAMELHVLKRFALDRKRVLSGIASAYAMGAKRSEVEARINNLLRQYLPRRDRDADELAEDFMKDQVSHEILSLAYSRTGDLRRWLLQQEGRLFKHRFNALNAHGRASCMCALRGGAWTPIAENTYHKLQDRLMAVFGGRNMNLQENSYSKTNAEYFHKISEPWLHIYAVPFEEVPDLVRGRQVFLAGGDAYVLSRDLDAIASTSFYKLLSDKLEKYKDHLEDIVYEENERLGPFLMAIPNADVSPAFVTEGCVALRELPAVLEASAPLCMRSSYGVLKANHHLKHEARLQFGLFLKGIGLGMEDALTFWRAEFMQGGKTAEDFERQYTYNFKHQYGQAGSRKNYAPYSCAKVINSSPDTSGATGCPFRICKPADLAKKLAGMSLATDVVAAVVHKATERHFQAACTMVYEARHAKMQAEGGVHHPNQYFKESQRHYKERQGDAGAQVQL
jgi:DNA primase large subunit